MLKKLKSNKGSALIIAIMVMIVLGGMAVFTVLMIGRSSKLSIERVNKKKDVIVLENTMYDCLNSFISDPSLLTFEEIRFNNNQGVITPDNNNYSYILKIEDNISSYSFKLSYKNLVLSCKVGMDLVYNSYQVLAWGIK